MQFLHKSIVDTSIKEIKELFKRNTTKDDFTMLAGCAPCQPYSMMNTRKNKMMIEKHYLMNLEELLMGLSLILCLWKKCK